MQVVSDAKARGVPLRISGGGTMSHYGRAINSGESLSLALLTGVTLYEPKELVLSARAGTKLKDLEALLAENNQGFAFEPPHFEKLFGHQTALETIGGIVATNRSGSRRVIAGAARDSLIGVNFVNGNSELVRTGGRVMKNVTGYDMTKLQAGAHGTLGVLIDLTFKLRPLSEVETTLVYKGLDVQAAVEAMSKALGVPQEVSSAAHCERDGVSQTLVRLEGFAASLSERVDEVAKALKAYGTPERLSGEPSKALWASVRDVADFVPQGTALWRISTVPSEAAGIVKALSTVAAAEPLLDWGGGLIWVAVPDEGDAHAARVRAAIAQNKGHATLLRASEATRLAAEPFHPLGAAENLVTQKIKAAFDPAAVLNPGFMYAGV